MSKQDKAQQGKNGGGAIPSRKMGIMVYYRNQIKRDYIYLLDYDPEVISFEEWPCTISYTQNGQEDSYTPDFCVARQQERRSIVICTWAAQTQNPQHLARWTATQLWCEKYGYELQLVTEIVLHKHQ